MFRGLVKSGAYAGNVNIPLSADIVTNDKSTLITTGTDANAVKLNSYGIVDIKSNVVFTPTAAGLVTMQLFANGVAIPGAVSTQTVDAGSTYTFNIADVVRVIPAVFSSMANISARISVAGTLVAGTFITEYRK